MTIDEAINHNDNLLFFMELENKKNPDYQFAEENFEALRRANSALAILKSKLEATKLKPEKDEWIIVRYKRFEIGKPEISFLHDLMNQTIGNNHLIIPQEINMELVDESNIITFLKGLIKRLEEENP